jgi:aspartate kinase
MPELIVHKFGGSCLRDKGDIDRIGQLVSSFTAKSVIVVSALWGVTDRLMRAANDPHYAGRLVEDLRRQHLRFSPGIEDSMHYDKFTKILNGISNDLVNLSTEPSNPAARNRILAAGERLSALVVAHRLQHFGLDAHPVGAEDIGLRLKGRTAAKIVDLENSKLTLSRDNIIGIPILTGWFGEGDDGEIAILTRGGSDHSASAFANLLKADRVILWKDVDGILALNPRWGIASPTVDYLGYGEAIELSVHGASILHPFTVEPLIESGIPLEIRNVFANVGTNARTLIGPDILSSTSKIKAIGCKTGVAIITTPKPLKNEFFQIIEEEGITVWSLNSTPSGSRLIISAHDLEIVEQELEDAKIESRTAIVSMVGNGIDTTIVELLNLKTEVISESEHGLRLILDTEDLTGSLAKLARCNGLISQ